MVKSLPIIALEVPALSDPWVIIINRTVNRIQSLLTFQVFSGLEPIAKASFGLSRADLQQVPAERGTAWLQRSAVQPAAG